MSTWGWCVLVCLWCGVCGVALKVPLFPKTRAEAHDNQARFSHPSDIIHTKPMPTATLVGRLPLRSPGLEHATPAYTRLAGCCEGWTPVHPRLWVSCQSLVLVCVWLELRCPVLPLYPHTAHRHLCAASTTTITALWSPPWAEAVEPGHIISNNSKEGPNIHGPFFKPWGERRRACAPIATDADHTTLSLPSTHTTYTLPLNTGYAAAGTDENGRGHSIRASFPSSYTPT